MMDILASLLMLPIYLQLQDFRTNPLGPELIVTLRAQQEAPACPNCQTPAHRIRSRMALT